jgi:RimJ/RimL family protein N-acetyltransferase
LVVRAICPDDQPALKRWFARISPESRYARFLSHVTELSPKQWSYLTAVDGHNHVAYVAMQGGQLAGVARWIRVADDPETAELAFLVGDEFQRTGIGTRLCARLVEAAREHGVRRFRAYVLTHNIGIRRLLDAPGFERLRSSGNTIEVRIRDVDRPSSAKSTT